MKLDILAFGAHPDDVELSCSGTILKHIALGKKVGIVDLTRGEMGTRGDAKTRETESAAASKILGIHSRNTLGLRDALFEYNEDALKAIISLIRLYQPEIVLANAVSDRHPDHERASKLVQDACFYAGLLKFETVFDGKKQDKWRPKAVYHYIQDRYIKPDLVIDVTDFWEKRTEAIMAFKSQFFDPESKEPQTPISGEEFQAHLKGRAANYGRQIGVKYAEGFTVERPPGIHDLSSLI